MSERVSITIPQLPAFLRLLRGNDLYREPWREALTTIVKLTEQVAISRAPMHSGATISHLTSKVSARELPMYALVKTNARNPRNKFLYPKLIEYSRHSPRAGWFRASFLAARSSWSAIFDHAIDKIGAIWSRSF
mgnify:CR=1 FL=1